MLNLDIHVECVYFYYVYELIVEIHICSCIELALKTFCINEMILKCIICWPNVKINVRNHKLEKTDCRYLNKRLTVFE